jgi:hypothetical protein
MRFANPRALGLAGEHRNAGCNTVSRATMAAVRPREIDF